MVISISYNIQFVYNDRNVSVWNKQVFEYYIILDEFNHLIIDDTEITAQDMRRGYLNNIL